MDSALEKSELFQPVKGPLHMDSNCRDALRRPEICKYHLATFAKKERIVQPNTKGQEQVLNFEALVSNHRVAAFQLVEEAAG